MAKPVKTNIAPPPMPPVTSWDSGNITTSANYALEGTTEFQNYVNSLAFSWIDSGINAHDFDYIFMAANGMDAVDLTVNSGTLQNGIIVTGNGMDSITGNASNELFFSGNGKDAVDAGGGNDYVYAGNGVDTVHGGAGDDYIDGENGDDQLYGDADNDTIWGGDGNDQIDGGSDRGTFSITTEEGGTELHLKDGHPKLLDSLPTGSVSATAPGGLDVAEIGIFVAVDGDGVPTEFIGSEPKMYFVYTVTPSVSGDYTIAYTRGNNIDGTGNPDPDIQHVHLEAGQTYYFNLFYDASNDQSVKVEVYSGTLTQAQIEATGGSSASPLDFITASVPNYHAFFEEVSVPGGTTLEFTAGDLLTGELGADTFIYDNTIVGHNVDAIYDYNQLEGDVLALKGVASADDFDVHTITTDVDGDGIVDSGIILAFGDDHAVALLGVSDIANVTITYG